jgi:hypothetical protein
LRTISFQLSDGDGGVSELATIDVRVVAVNDAPVLNNAGNPVLTAIREDTANPPGTLVKDFAAAAISDVDPGAVEGIAVIVAPASKGAWQFTLDGVTWQPMGKTTSLAARLLPADDVTRVRFIPKTDFYGDVQLTYRAWDQTQGVAGGLMPTEGNIGGDDSLSKAAEKATLSVTPVNDAPLVNLGGVLAYTRNASPIFLAPSATVSDIDSPDFDRGQLRARITTGAHSSNRLAIGGPFSVDSDNNVSFGGAIIGRRTSNGVGWKELVVVFNASVTPALAQTLVQAITFQTVGGPTGARYVFFNVSDGDGATSPARSVRVNVS